MVDSLRRALPVSAVVLFGSRARGEHTQFSDFDLAVISPAFSAETRMYRRTEALLEALGSVRGIDAVGLSPEELEALDSLIVLDAVTDGLPLFDDGCFLRARERLAARIARGEIARIPGGWRVGPVPAGRDQH